MAFVNPYARIFLTNGQFEPKISAAKFEVEGRGKRAIQRSCVKKVF